MVVGASILNGESAEAVDSGFEEIVTGTVPVSDGSEVVEQGVQGQDDHVCSADYVSRIA